MGSQTIVKDFMSSPVITVLPATALKEAVQLLSENHFSGLPVVNDQEQLIGEITEQDLMVRESGIDAGPYVLLLDSVIYLRNPLNWDKQVHQVLGNTVNALMRSNTHSCQETLPLAQAAAMLNARETQRLFVIDAQQKPVGVLTRGDVIRALAKEEP